MHCCCTSDDSAAPAFPSPSTPSSPPSNFNTWARRFATLFQWAIPLTTLALIPKCPACIAAYILLFTGLGLSFPAAAATRWTLIALSSVTLAYLLLRTASRAIRPQSGRGTSPPVPW